MRCAIFYSGQFRSLDRCYNNHLENIFSKLKNYDVFADIEVSTDIEKYKNFIENNIQNIKKFSIYTEPSPVHRVSIRPQNLRGEISTWLRQIKSIRDSFNLCENIDDYDIAIRIRTDSLFDRPLENLEDLDLSSIYIPNHDNWGGYNDRFAIGNIINMKKYLSFYDAVPLFGGLVKGNAEGYLKYYIDEYCKIPVNKTNIVGQTMREDGSLVEIFFN
jgi:hypothetical protein